MATTVKLYLGPNFGAVVNGNAGGPYTQGSDGTAIVDARDVPALLSAGATYLNSAVRNYGQTPAVAAATVGKFVASGALSNGALAIANQPDVPRQARVVWGAGTVALSAGQVSVSYIANDGTIQTDVVSLALAASGTGTSFLTKGVVHLQTPTVSAVSGGASPFIQIDSTTALSVPVDFNAKDVAFLKETIDTGDEAVGTVSTTTLATITPTTAPNNTHTYGFLYSFLTPDV